MPPVRQNLPTKPLANGSLGCNFDDGPHFSRILTTRIKVNLDVLDVTAFDFLQFLFIAH